ncbi:unnamed protein product [Polarella glacialis]|uniref:Uncharacterized protein n=1 Tax=Polarella glacialis TaxID=89957 RepID=A0A813JSV3_POLGL|nr:unnamed protein product [Polarella glacialis]
MLTGFFNFLTGVEQRCESQKLEPPEDLFQSGFRALALVKQAVPESPESALSQFFIDAWTGQAFPKPGFDVARDQLNKVIRASQSWTEEILSGAGLEVYSTYSAMQPYLKQVGIVNGSAQLVMTVDGSTGFDCIAELTGDDSAAEETDGSSGSETLSFQGLLEEDGLILRHFRLDLRDSNNALMRRRRLQEEDEEDAIMMGAFIQAGIMPTHMDYFDVDSDPSGRRASGAPYRVTHDSDVSGARVFSGKTYVSISSLPQDLTVANAMAALNITQIASACRSLDPNGTVIPAMTSLLAQSTAS